MDQQIRKALEKCITAYAEVEQLDVSEVWTGLEGAFVSEQPFLEKVARLDAVFDDYPRFEELREIAFDLLLMNFFEADAARLENDYLESESWEAIEDQTIDRGTELLNLLLYLRECVDEEIEPQLNDYLKEFLLVEEDEFQDEHRIYEPVIANQLLVDSSYQEIAKVAAKMDDDQELAELFYPLMSFFFEQRPSAADWSAFNKESASPAFDCAVYGLIVAFNN